MCYETHKMKLLKKRDPFRSQNLVSYLIKLFYAPDISKTSHNFLYYINTDHIHDIIFIIYGLNRSTAIITNTNKIINEIKLLSPRSSSKNFFITILQLFYIFLENQHHYNDKFQYNQVSFFYKIEKHESPLLSSNPHLASYDLELFAI